MPDIAYFIIIVSALIGFALSLHIYRKKRSPIPLVCPLKSDCQAVLFSRFGSFFGIPLELLGIVYYGLITLGYGWFWLWPAAPALSFSLLLLTTFGFVFSLYLTFIQGVIIREWCVWCLSSASFSIIIFITSLFGYGQEAAWLWQDNLQLIIAGAILGAALGIGGATVYATLFAKFLRDLIISPAEKATLETVSQVIWFGLFTVAIFAPGLFLNLDRPAPDAGQLLVALIILAVLIVNETILNLLIAPRLLNLTFAADDEVKLPGLRRWSFITVAVSLISWYVLLIVLILPLPMTYPTLITGYGLLLMVALLAGFYFDYLVRQPRKNRQK